MKYFIILLTTLATISCNRVNFSSKSSGTDDAPIPGSPTSTTVKVKELGTISCQVYLNDHLSSVTITLPGTNPTVTADCTPKDLSYNWTVKKDGNTVTVNGLTGRSSNPDFTSLGAGTYVVGMTATATDYKPYTATPVTVIIKSNTPTPPSNVTCDPRMNGSLKNLTLTDAGSTVSMAANCNPPDSSCQWTVTLDGKTVNVTGMSGCNPTGDFRNQPPGTYNVYLTANRPDYNTYTTNQPMTVVIPKKTTRSVSTKKDVTLQDNQLDVILIVDDSNSMLSDNQKLAEKLQGFVNDLSASGFDWQMCVTVTRAQQITSSDPNLYWGASRNWVGLSSTTPWILKSGAGDLKSIFTNTINQIGAGWIGTDDERGIKAAWWHLWNGDINYAGNSGCYRKDAGLSVIMISDEDVRSVGGDASLQYYAGEYKPLDPDDYGIHYYDEVRTVFGPTKRFNVNSIIVRPGDSACMKSQDDAGSKSHYGYRYEELSKMSNGSVTSICSADYSSNLTYFKENIIKEMASLPLECNPVGGTVKVTISPDFTTSTRVENSTLYFSPKVPAGKTISAEYECSL